MKPQRASLVLAALTLAVGLLAPRAGAAPLELRHPVVLAHGAAWIDALGIEKLQGNYWQGVDARLEELGVDFLAPKVEPTGTIAERAEQLKRAILEAYPHRRVNIVAHSMGGLDARYMVTMLGMKDHVASVTTLATPHHGSWYADFASKWVFRFQGLNWLAGKAKVNFKAIDELTVENMEKYFNPTVTDVPTVDYYSYAGTTSLWEMPLYQWGMKLVISLAEKAAARKGVGRASRAALEKALPGAAEAALQMGQEAQGRHPWLLADEAGRSDGVVSTSSARWGTYMGEFDAHHLAQIGTSERVDHVTLWETILRRLADMGY